MKKSSEQTRLGERHIEVLSNNSTDKQHIDLVVRVVYKIKSRDNGFERFFATINNERTEVFENINGKTGASFTVIKPIDSLGEIPKESEIHPTPLPYEKENCPNCADQASIAASGETLLCKTHSDEKHYREMNEFFDSQLSNLKFSVHMPFCSACGNDEAYYIGYIQGEITITHYSFCKDCRSKLVLEQNAARTALERIGA